MTSEAIDLMFDGPDADPSEVHFDTDDCVVSIRGRLYPRQLYLAAKLIQEIMASKRQAAKLEDPEQ